MCGVIWSTQNRLYLGNAFAVFHFKCICRMSGFFVLFAPSWRHSFVNFVYIFETTIAWHAVKSILLLDECYLSGSSCFDSCFSCTSFECISVYDVSCFYVNDKLLWNLIWNFYTAFVSRLILCMNHLVTSIFHGSFFFYCLLVLNTSIIVLANLIWHFPLMFGYSFR